MPTAPRNQRRIRLVDRDGSSDAARYARAQRRAGLVVGVMSFWLVACIGAAVHHVVHVADVRKYAEINTTHRSKVKTRRGDVFDRNMVALATDVRSDSVTADPRWVRPAGRANRKLPLDHPQVLATKQQVARIIARVTRQPYKGIRERLGWKRGFVYLAKNIDAKASRALRHYIRRGDLPGVRIEPGFRRHYPNGDLAGLVLGRHNWSATIESTYDRLLRGQIVEVLAYKDRHSDRLYFDGTPDPRKFGGRSLVLTLDEKIQAVAEKELRKGVRDGVAEHGFAIVMDVENGEVLAMATWPGTDPGTGDKPKFGFRNPVVQDQFEPGSTLKVITLAAALEEKAVWLHSQFKTGDGYRVGDKTITDTHRRPMVTAEEAIKYSSNVGIAKIAARIGKEKLHDYLQKFGFGRRPDSGLSGEIAGTLAPPERWSKVQFANIAFGQGIAATPLQVAASIAAIGAGGMYRRPRLVRGEIAPDGLRKMYPISPGERVISEDTARRVLRAMKTVCQKGGTAPGARLHNYTIAGKTGTAQQVEPGRGYSKTHWVASFAALAPAEKPKIAVLVAIDTPRKRHKRYPSIIIRTGGQIAAPVVREIARFTLPYLGVQHSRGAPYLAADDPDRARKKDAQRRELAEEAVQDEDEELETLLVDEAERHGGKATVPDLRGLPLTRARLRLARLGLELSPDGSGVVVSQQPAPGVLAPAGAVVKARLMRFTELAAAQPGKRERP